MGGGSGNGAFRTATPFTAKVRRAPPPAPPDCHPPLVALSVVHNYWQGPDPFESSVTESYPSGDEGDLLVAFLVLGDGTPVEPAGWDWVLYQNGGLSGTHSLSVLTRERGAETSVTINFSASVAWDLILLDTPYCPDDWTFDHEHNGGTAGASLPQTVPYSSGTAAVDVLDVWTRRTSITSWWDTGTYTLDDDPTPDRVDAGFVPLTDPTEGTQVLWVRDSVPRVDTLITATDGDLYGYVAVGL